jgi:hypothetical protein
LAKNELEQARELGATSKEANAARCYAFEGLRASKEAAQCFFELTAKLPATDPDLASYLYSLGTIYNGGHESAAALTAFRRYVDLKGSTLPPSDRVFSLIRSLEQQTSQSKLKQETPTPSKPNSRRSFAKVPSA